MKYVYYFFSFWENEMKIIKEMKEVLIASGILFAILMCILVFTQMYF